MATNNHRTMVLFHLGLATRETDPAKKAWHIRKANEHLDKIK